MLMLTRKLDLTDFPSLIKTLLTFCFTNQTTVNVTAYCIDQQSHDFFFQTLELTTIMIEAAFCID